MEVKPELIEGEIIIEPVENGDEPICLILPNEENRVFLIRGKKTLAVFSPAQARKLAACLMDAARHAEPRWTVSKLKH